MQQSKSHQLGRMGGIGQQQQTTAVHQHARRRHATLVVFVAHPGTGQHTDDLPHGHQQNEPSGLGHGIAQALFHVADGMHIDRGDHQQGHTVAQTQQPKRLGAQGLPRGELHTGAARVNGILGGQGMGFGHAIDRQTHVLGSTPDHRGQGNTNHQSHHRRGHGRGAPAKAVHRPRHQRHRQAAQRQSQAEQGQSTGALALEPMDDGHGEREVATQTGPHRQDDGTDIKPRDGFDLGQGHKPDGEDNDPPADHGLRAKAVHDPTQQGPQDGRLQRLHRRCAGQRGLAPTALFSQHGHVSAKGLGQQRRLHELQ